MNKLVTPPLIAGAIYQSILRDGSVLECVCISTEASVAPGRGMQGVLRNHKQGDLSVSDGSEGLAHFALVAKPTRLAAVFVAGKHYKGKAPAVATSSKKTYAKKSE
tara:strand:- start:1895 stop:2212 length:318 start_codon:yes stop_codon:yes gene_type:complete